MQYGERAIWLAVLFNAASDARYTGDKRGRKNDARNAYAYIRYRNKDFTYVCKLADVNEEKTRKALLYLLTLEPEEFRLKSFLLSQERKKTTTKKYFHIE